MLVALGLAVWATAEFRRRRALAARLAQIESQMAELEQSRSAAAVTEQQFERTLGLTHLSKMQAELELLKRQVASAAAENDREVAAKEYHELMVEKARLEIDALRLQVAEMRRRSEDWRSDLG